MPELVLVVDCGATNVTVAAVDGQGGIVSSTSKANGPVPQPDGQQGWLVWDLSKLWWTICAGIRETVEDVPGASWAAVTVTTWGADGAPVTAGGELTYPIIAWECPRTGEVMRRLSERIGARRLFDITGYQAIGFNTLFKLAWLRENAPDALDRADTWLMMPGLLSHRLCGESTVDVTSASTMMMLDLRTRAWAVELLRAVGLEESFFPPMVYPGDVIGALTAEAARQTGLPEGIPVVAAGHDTQFAPIGSGAVEDEAVLSTGTWEIAMVRTEGPASGTFAFEQGIITEADAVRDLYDPQLLMMGSGVLEWVRESFFGGISDRSEAYETMIGGARKLTPGCGGVMMVPSFVPETGPTRKYRTAGTIVGLGLSSTPAHIYRAALEGLCFQLRQALKVLCEATGFTPARLRVVGGGARNDLWNQLRADACRMPVVVTERKEATVVGAAVSAWVGAGRFGSIQEGARRLITRSEIVQPSGQAGIYDELFERYSRIAPALKDFYCH